MPSRRTFISATCRAAGGFAIAPAVLLQETSRPAAPFGVAAGDVTGDRAVIWSHTDRPARLFVEWSTRESFEDVRRMRGSLATPDTGFTARADIAGLPQGQRIFYRVLFEDVTNARATSVPVTGSFASAPSQPRDVSFTWGADTVGQGWGINREFGGMRIYESMRRLRPDFFIHCGDTIYADAPVPPEIRLPDGSLWKNVVTEAKSKVAETLAEFRGNYTYNLLDEPLRRFNAEVAQIVLWDDHEVKNNWYPGMSLQDDPRYREKNAARLIANARQAFLEYSPIRVHTGVPPPIYRSCAYGPLVDVFALDLRTYRAPNSANRQPAPSRATEHAGPSQIAWLKQALRRSRATWKVMASDLPIGLVVRDGEHAFEAIANADDGPPLGRELEIADLLRFIRRERIRNVVWVTGDVHYAAAHHYDPARARVTEFDAFWEFVAGPLNAVTGTPLPLDATFGPEVRFTGVPPDFERNNGPAAGLQFFGRAHIDAKTRHMNVSLHKLDGEQIYAIDLAPQP